MMADDPGDGTKQSLHLFLVKNGARSKREFSQRTHVALAGMREKGKFRSGRVREGEISETIKVQWHDMMQGSVWCPHGMTLTMHMHRMCNRYYNSM